MANILLVEDEAVLRETIAYNLKSAGHAVHPVEDGEAALNAIQDGSAELVILDIMLPTIDGFEVCRQIRRTSSIPILILTARDDEIDRVVGLEIGAETRCRDNATPGEFITGIASQSQSHSRYVWHCRYGTLARTYLKPGCRHNGEQDGISG